MSGELQPIQVLPGVEPSTDRSSTTTQHYTNAKHIRFVGGFPEKIGGWESLSLDFGEAIDGKTRSIFSYKLSGYIRYLIGTNTRLYDLFGSVATNITPVKTSTIAIADSLDTYYGTLSSDPLATIDGSTTITVTDTAHKFQVGDTATLSGASTTNGIPAGEINTDQYVRSVTTNSWTFIVSTAATATGSGGGASVVRTSGHITVNSTSHALGDGDRVKIASAADTGGITAAQINLEHIIRNVTTNAFDVYTTGTATSSVSSGGGASTTYQKPIDSGTEDTLQGQGYGVGLYGVGLYGVSKSSSATTSARIWSHDRFGDLTISCAGQGTGIYSWDGDTSEAPVLVTNAPTTVNYVFTSNDIVVALGYDGSSNVGNGITWSDQGGITNWSTGQAGSDRIEGAGRFISHAPASSENLLFTENQTYTFRYIGASTGGVLTWQTRFLENIGLIAQNARVSVSGVVYWMGLNNFYMWRGATVEVIPSNSGTESTLRNYVFEDINRAQKDKCFAWYNTKFREVWFHYPSAASNEPDRIARFNIDTFEWTLDELTRTAAEYPSILTQNPYLTNDSSVVYLHENGLDADGSGMDWTFTTPFLFGGTNTIEHAAFIPDQSMTGNVTVNIKTKNYPSSASNIYNKTYTITPNTERVPTEINGRYFQYTVSGSDAGQEFTSGQWYHELKRSSLK